MTFWSVAEDSRCPIDAICVQAGQASIVVRLSKGGQSLGEFILSTTQENNRVSVDQYSIRLTNVEPAPISTKTIDISDYRVKLIVSRK